MCKACRKAREEFERGMHERTKKLLQLEHWRNKEDKRAEKILNITLKKCKDMTTCPICESRVLGKQLKKIRIEALDMMGLLHAKGAHSLTTGKKEFDD